jgi:hypothetical protein
MHHFSDFRDIARVLDLSASSCCHPRVRSSWAAAHASNALKRYMLPDLNEATMVTMKIYKLQNDQQVINIPKGIKKDKLLILLKLIDKYWWRRRELNPRPPFSIKGFSGGWPTSGPPYQAPNMYLPC